MEALEKTWQEVLSMEKDTYTLVDTRDELSFAYGNIPGSINLSEEALLAEADQWKDKTLVLYCKKGEHSLEVAGHLREAGWQEVYSLKGGYLGWLMQRMQTEDKDGVCYQRVSLDDVLPGEEQLRRIEAVADPYAMQPQSIMEEQESRRELYNGLQRLTDREQTYLLYRYGFTDGEEHPLIGTAIYFHLTKSRAKKTEEQAMDNLWLELPWWFD